jgi:hypothetical protein
MTTINFRFKFIIGETGDFTVTAVAAQLLRRQRFD